VVLDHVEELLVDQKVIAARVLEHLRNSTRLHFQEVGFQLGAVTDKLGSLRLGDARLLRQLRILRDLQ